MGLDAFKCWRFRWIIAVFMVYWRFIVLGFRWIFITRIWFLFLKEVLRNAGTSFLLGFNLISNRLCLASLVLNILSLRFIIARFLIILQFVSGMKLISLIILAIKNLSLVVCPVEFRLSELWYFLLELGIWRSNHYFILLEDAIVWVIWVYFDC